MTALSHGLRRKATTAALAGLAVLGVLLTACGGNGDNEAAQRARSATIAASSGPDGLVKIGRRSEALRAVQWDRFAHGRDGGRRRGHQRLVRLRRTGRRQDDPHLRLRPRQPRAERSRAGPARPGRVGRRPRATAQDRADPRPLRPGRHLRRRLHHRGHASAHPDDVAGMVFIDTGAPLEHPPREIVEATDPNHPANVERRDYLQVERDAWAARKRIGDIPVAVVSVKFSAAAIKESPFPAERKAMRRNVERQRGWLVLSPARSRSWRTRATRLRRTTPSW